MLKIGIDVGGTFTDGLMIDDSTGQVSTCKVPSTREDPSLGVARALEVLMKGRNWNEVGFLAHGTTVATNAVIEARGPKTALVTTRGFRDALEIGRMSRPAPLLYNYRTPLPAPLVPRQLRLEVTERIDASGRVLTPLDEAEMRSVAAQLAAEGVEAVAVCFLHSYANSTHERRAAEVLAEVMDGVAVSISSDVLPEVGEFERASTTSANAFLQPLMGRYLGGLSGRTLENRSVSGLEWRVMQSNGGMAGIEYTQRYPVHTLLSGPAAGVAGGAHLGRLLGLNRLITADMGGTSLDVALIANGAVEVTTAREIAFRPIRVPMLDIEAVGAGGGSIAWIDASGSLRVGPESAGSTPGPACYSRGGQEATVSDANLVLNYLPPNGVLGDEIKLNRDLAVAACERVGAKLGLNAVETANAIIQIVNHTMSDAIATITIRRGHEPQDFALCAFGGAGGMHAVAMAEALEIPWVVIPATPGVYCALGLTVADLTHTYMQTLAGLEVSQATIRPVLDALRSRAEDALRSDGVDAKNVEIREQVDARYVGQVETLTVPFGESTERATHLFEMEYERQYGFKRSGNKVELVNARVHAVGRVHGNAERNNSAPANPIAEEASTTRKRKAFFHGVGWTDTTVVNRNMMQPSLVLAGPAVVEQGDATTVIPPGYVAIIDESTKAMIIGRQPWKRSSNV